MQRIELTFNYGTKEFSNKSGKEIPCLFSEGDSQTTNSDLSTYAWSTPENDTTEVQTQKEKAAVVSFGQLT